MIRVIYEVFVSDKGKVMDTRIIINDDFQFFINRLNYIMMEMRMLDVSF